MKIILDTKVVLDVLLERKPFSDAAAPIFALAEQSRVDAFLCATTITTIDYLLTRSPSPRAARGALHRLLSLFEIATVNRPAIERALASRISDFEDAVLAASGQLAGVDCIVTRNTRDFAGCGLKVFDPVELLALLGESCA